LNPAETVKILSDRPIKPDESAGPKAKPNPTIQKPKTPEIASSKFLTNTVLQCYLLVPAASTMINPSCIKKITAVAAKIQLELEPVFISSRIASC